MEDFIKERHQDFEYVKRTFFPRWDTKGEWVFEIFEGSNGVLGTCNAKKKMIRMLSVGAPSEKHQCLIVHEICHAVTDCCHGKKWRTRMEKAAVKADQIGRPDMAAELRLEAEGYEACTQRIGATVEFYQMVQDWVSCDRHGCTEEEMLTAVGEEIGLTYAEVLEGYPRARKVFAAARKDADETRRAQEKWKAMLSQQST